jgi:hypothetical protein
MDIIVSGNNIDITNAIINIADDIRVIADNDNIVDPEIMNKIYIDMILDNNIIDMCNNFTRNDLSIIFSFPEEIICLMLKNLLSVKCNIDTFNNFFCEFIKKFMDHKHIDNIIGDNKIIIDNTFIKDLPLKTCLIMVQNKSIEINVVEIAKQYNYNQIYNTINLDDKIIEFILKEFEKHINVDHIFECFKTLSNEQFKKFVNYAGKKNTLDIYNLQGLLISPYLTNDDIKIMAKRHNLNIWTHHVPTRLIFDLNSVYYEYIKNNKIQIKFNEDCIKDILKKPRTTYIKLLSILKLYNEKHLDEVIPIFKKLIPMLSNLDIMNNFPIFALQNESIFEAYCQLVPLKVKFIHFEKYNTKDTIIILKYLNKKRKRKRQTIFFTMEKVIASIVDNIGDVILTKFIMTLGKKAKNKIIGYISKNYHTISYDNLKYLCELYPNLLDMMCDKHANYLKRQFTSANKNQFLEIIKQPLYTCNICWENKIQHICKTCGNGICELCIKNKTLIKCAYCRDDKQYIRLKI